MEGRIKPKRCPSAPPATRLEAQSKAWTYGPNGLLSIPLARGFEGDSRNGDKLGSDWCIICNPFSAYVQVATSEFLGDVAIGFVRACTLGATAILSTAIRNSGTWRGTRNRFMSTPMRRILVGLLRLRIKRQGNRRAGNYFQEIASVPSGRLRTAPELASEGDKIRNLRSVVTAIKQSALQPPASGIGRDGSN